MKLSFCQHPYVPGCQNEIFQLLLIVHHRWRDVFVLVSSLDLTFCFLGEGCLDHSIWNGARAGGNILPSCYWSVGRCSWQWPSLPPPPSSSSSPSPFKKNFLNQWNPNNAFSFLAQNAFAMPSSLLRDDEQNRDGIQGLQSKSSYYRVFDFSVSRWTF